jgi:hypothetical protein
MSDPKPAAPVTNGKKVTPELLDKLKAEHRYIAYVNGEFDDEIVWEVVLRKPTSKEYKQLRAQVTDGNQKAMAGEAVFRKIIIYPSRDQIDALLEEWPGVAEACGGAINKLAGLVANEGSK